MTIFGLDWLSFLDTVTNTVFMPVCAFLSCVAVGWFIKPKQALLELKADNNGFGKFEKIVTVMIKFIVPALIAVIEIFGVAELVFPNGVFSANGLGIVLVSLSLFGVLISLFFLLLKNKETGDNLSELS